MKKKTIRQKGAASVRGLFAPIALLVLSAFVLLAFRKEEFDGQALVAGGVLLVLLYGSYRMFCGVYPECDRHLLIIVDLLIAVGIIVQYRIAPDTALKQLLSIGIGIVAMFVAALLFSDTERLKSRALCYLLMVARWGCWRCRWCLATNSTAQKTGSTWVFSRCSPASSSRWCWCLCWRASWQKKYACGTCGCQGSF